MSLWGNTDLVSNTGTVGIAITNGLVTGQLTTFSDDGVSEGDVIKVGVGATYGYGVVASVTDNTTLTLKSVQFLADAATFGVTRTTDVPAGTTFEISEEPVYAMSDTAYAAPEVQTGLSTTVTRSVYGIDHLEVGVAATTAYRVGHSGWVGITTYVDCHGYTRVRHEVLVAGGISTASDSASETLI